eukprot:1809646-Karenia_brevis.AAC.1
MQSEVGEPVDGSTLAGAAATAGRSTHRVQAGLTRARERHMSQALDIRMRALHADDGRRLAWLNVDRYSAAWVSALPAADLWVTNAEFLEIASRYFGLPSPACRALVGQRIGNTGQTLDRHGFRLCAASLPGD